MTNAIGAWGEHSRGFNWTTTEWSQPFKASIPITSKSNDMNTTFIYQRSSDFSLFILMKNDCTREAVRASYQHCSMCFQFTMLRCCGCIFEDKLNLEAFNIRRLLQNLTDVSYYLKKKSSKFSHVMRAIRLQTYILFHTFSEDVNGYAIMIVLWTLCHLSNLTTRERRKCRRGGRGRKLFWGDTSSCPRFLGQERIFVKDSLRIYSKRYSSWIMYWCNFFRWWLFIMESKKIFLRLIELC